MRKKTVELDYVGVRVPRPLTARIHQLIKWKTTRSTVLIRCLEIGLPILEAEMMQDNTQNDETKTLAA